MKIIGLINLIVSGFMSKILSTYSMTAYSVQTYFLFALKLPISI